MAPTRSVRLRAICAITLLGIASGAIAAEDAGVIQPPYSYSELRVGVSGVPAPQVRETRPKSYGFDGDSRGTRFSLTWLKGSAKADSITGWVGGLSFSLATFNVSDDVSGVSDRDLEQYIGDVYYGFQYGIVQTEGLRGWGEILPFAGFGASRFSLPDNKGNLESHFGPVYEAGIKTGVYLTERGWLVGLTSSLLWNYSRVKSEAVSLNMRTNGFTFGGEFGYRF